MAYNLKLAMLENSRELERVLDSLLKPEEGPEHKVIDAMRYSTLGGGKRIRPFLVMSCAELFEVKKDPALRVAAAFEMVHCYSLIHDDLPAMDNDNMRRGRPTCHVQFDEATAILAGDALLTKAFEILVGEKTHQDAHVRIDLVRSLAKACGHAGMVGGQMLDIEAEDHELKMPEITRLQRMKTGELISASCEAGAILGKAPDHSRQLLYAYAHDIGLAFQITDDLLDVEGDEEAVGKKTGKDMEAGKATFVSLLGVQRARKQAELLGKQAQKHLEPFGDVALPLCHLAHFIVNRSS